MIAIILWLAAIIFIAASITPGFFTGIIISVVAFAFLYAFFAWIGEMITRCFTPKKKSIDLPPRIRSQDIEEWERKWKRPHPSRKINRKH